MKYCNKCGAELRVEAKFCPKCGNVVMDSKNVEDSKIIEEIPKIKLEKSVEESKKITYRGHKDVYGEIQESEQASWLKLLDGILMFAAAVIIIVFMISGLEIGGVIRDHAGIGFLVGTVIGVLVAFSTCVVPKIVITVALNLEHVANNSKITAYMLQDMRETVDYLAAKESEETKNEEK